MPKISTKPKPVTKSRLGQKDHLNAASKGQLISALARYGLHGRELASVIRTTHTMHDNMKLFKAYVQELWKSISKTNK